MRMHRLLLALGVTAGTLALLAGLVLAFSDSQTSAGAVNATTASADLYICEASEATAGPNCAGDDSGPDETIFEGMENLLPGQSFHADIRLKNVGSSSWDVVDAVPQVTIASDPGGDCNAQLVGDETFGFTAISTRALVAAVPLGRDPGSVAVDPNTNRIYVVNRLDGTISVIDGTTNTEIDTDNDAGNGVTRLGFGGAWAVSVNPITNRIYVTGGSTALRVIDGVNYSTVTDVSIVSGTSPGPVAVNSVTNRIYTSGNGLAVIDGSTNQVIANVAGVDARGGLAVDIVTNRAFAGTGNVVYAVDGATNTQIDTDGSPGNGTTPITLVQTSIRGMAVNEDSDRVYLALGQTAFGASGMAVIDGSTYTVSGIVSTGGNPVDVAADKVNEKVYIAKMSGNEIVAFEASTNASVGGMAGGTTPAAVAVNEGTNRVYVANTGSTNLSVFNGTYLNHAPLQSSGFLRIDGSGPVDVHVRPGDYEDMRVFVKMPFDVPDGCADASWNVSLVWTVRIHAS